MGEGKGKYPTLAMSSHPVPLKWGIAGDREALLKFTVQQQRLTED